MKRKIHISNQSINMTNNASFRFCVYKSHQLFRTCIGVLIFRLLFHRTSCSTVFPTNRWPILCPTRRASLPILRVVRVHTFGNGSFSARSAIYDQQRYRTFRHPSTNFLSSIDSHFPRHVRRYRTLLLRVVFQSILQPSVRWQHTRLTGKKDYSREKNLNTM